MYEITVVVPVYNAENTILKSINSLKNQTFSKWCCIIVNDGSTDNTRLILNDLNDKRFQVVNFDENLGRPAARQTALEMVKTKYLCMLDADDWCYPNKLSFQYNFMEENPEVTLMSTAMGVVDEDNLLYAVLSPFDEAKELFFNDYFKYIRVPHASSIIRVKDVNSVGYNLSLKFGEDQDFMRRLLLGKKYVFVNEIMYIYHRDESFSFDKYKRTMIFEIQSTILLPISHVLKSKEIVKIKLKIFIVWFLFFLNLESFYLKRVGRKPNLNENNTYSLFKDQQGLI